MVVMVAAAGELGQSLLDQLKILLISRFKLSETTLQLYSSSHLVAVVELAPIPIAVPQVETSMFRLAWVALVVMVEMVVAFSCLLTANL